MTAGVNPDIPAWPPNVQERFVDVGSMPDADIVAHQIDPSGMVDQLFKEVAPLDDVL